MARFTEAETRFMSRALRIARRGEGRVEPNPMVGCVIAKKGRIIGEGHHARFGGPHAEIRALESRSEAPRHADVYVTLEPCGHTGKTPPCVDALIEAGVRSVTVAARDPNPAVNGRGLRRLRRAGINVRCGLLADEGAALLAPFATRMKLHRPYVIAKWAQSLDGKLATEAGHSQWISCATSRRAAHRLRARVDAILVGAGTACTDDPLLTARGVTLRRTAMRVVIDGRLRMPLTTQLVTTADETPTLLLTARDKAASPKADRLRRAGVEIVAARNSRGRLDLSSIMRHLANRDVTNLMVEGGPETLTAFFNARLIDEAHIYVAPKLIGGDNAPGPLRGRGPRRMDDVPAPWLIETSRSGIDTRYRLVFTDPTGI